jgi:(p)ppGpp synthase/HD superfamily hydrolase
MPTLKQALSLAKKAHNGQLDKAGESYISHPLRVMRSVETEAERIVAILHDVLEDTRYSIRDLQRMGYKDEIVAALDALTRRKGERYQRFIRRAGKNPLARRIKIADLEDNMDIRRLKTLKPSDLRRLAKYHRAWLLLKEKSL